MRVLLEFILFHCSADKWPSTKNEHFWCRAAQYVKECSGHHVARSVNSIFWIEFVNDFVIQFANIFVVSGMACRYKVIVGLKKRFNTPKDAKDELLPSAAPAPQAGDAAVQTDQAVLPATTPLMSLRESVSELSPDEQMHAISSQFCEIVASKHGVRVPSDFLPKAASAMVQLQSSGRSNVLYTLASGIGTTRSGSEKSRFPTDRMPMGLLEHMVNFFASLDMTKVC